MKVQKTIKKETCTLAAGSFVLTAVMAGIFALWHRLDYTVVLGAAIGLTAAVLDFFLLGITVQKAAEIQAAHPIAQSENSMEDADGSDNDDGKRQFADPETAKAIKKKIQSSYYLRRLMLVAFAMLGLTPFVNLIAVVVPMTFPKLIIQIRNFAQMIPKGARKGE